MIHVDSVITQRDMFRVNLNLVRFRLAVGCMLAVLAVLSLTWFFWFIDELKILVQVSPLFIGLPLMSVIGQVLRLHAGCRKHLKSIPESHRRVQVHFQDDADGYDVIQGDSFSHVSWGDLMKVVELKDYFIFYFSSFDLRILPKRGFHQQTDVSLLRQLLVRRLADRARLLPDSVRS